MPGVTRLQAVNICLEGAGDAAINSLGEVDTSYDAGQASRIIDQVTREVCEEGWNWNRRDKVEFSPDIDGYVQIPSSIVSVEPTLGYQRWDTKYQERSTTDDSGNTYRRLFDQLNDTDVLDEDPIYLDIYEYKTFDELPPVAKNYVTHKAARVYQHRATGDLQQISVSTQEEIDAHAKLLDYEMHTDDVNGFDEAYAQWGAFGNRRRGRGGTPSRLYK